MAEHVWQVKQGGMVVAKGFAPDRPRAEAECSHYGFQYQMDGPVEVTVRKCPKRKRKSRAVPIEKAMTAG